MKAFPHACVKCASSYIHCTHNNFSKTTISKKEWAVLGVSTGFTGNTVREESPIFLAATFYCPLYIDSGRLRVNGYSYTQRDMQVLQFCTIEKKFIVVIRWNEKRASFRDKKNELFTSVKRVLIAPPSNDRKRRNLLFVEGSFLS